MANEEYLGKLKASSIVEWNKWRTDNMDTVLDLTHADLRGRNFRNADFRSVNFTDANLSHADLTGAILHESKLVSANLVGANFTKADLHSATFINAYVSEANFSEAILNFAIFTNAFMKDANISGARFIGAKGLTHAQIDMAVYSPDRPPQLNIDEVTDNELEDVTKEKERYLQSLKLSVDAWNVMREIDPDSKNYDLNSIDLSNTDLKLINFTNVNLTLANLDNADLMRADLSGASLHRASFNGTSLFATDLTGAKLSSADFSEADLSDAILTNADLAGTNFDGAKLSGTIITGAGLMDVKNLTQEQVDSATYNLKNPPKLPVDLVLHRLIDIGNEGAELGTETQLPKSGADVFSSKDIFGSEDFFDPAADGARSTLERIADQEGNPFSEQFSSEFGSSARATDVELETISSEGTMPLRAHPRDRQILSGQLNTPTMRLRREASEQELTELRDLLARCEPTIEKPGEGENVLRVPIEQEALDLMRSVVKTAIELHKAPSYPEGLIRALEGVGSALRALKLATDFAPIPKFLSDKMDSAITTYDAFLTELGLL